MNSRLHAWIGTAISLPLIYVVFKEVDIKSIGLILHQASAFWLLIALVFYWAEILVRILRWQRILSGVDNTIQYLPAGMAFCVGTAANNIFPFRLGDILRAHLVGIQRNISRYSLMGTIVLEKLIDVAAILLLTCWGAFEALKRLGAISGVNSAFLVCALGMIITAGLYQFTGNKNFHNKLMAFIYLRFMHFRKGFGAILKLRIFAFVLAETVLIWTFNTLAIWAIIRSLGLSLSIAEALLLEGICGLAAAIPSAPAGIGVMQYAFLVTFGILELNREVGVAASLLVQGVLLASITLAGVLIFTFDAQSKQALVRFRHE